jgi:hypothetical protein
LDGRSSGFTGTPQTSGCPVRGVQARRVHLGEPDQHFALSLVPNVDASTLVIVIVIGISLALILWHGGAFF